MAALKIKAKQVSLEIMACFAEAKADQNLPSGISFWLPVMCILRDDSYDDRPQLHAADEVPLNQQVCDWLYQYVAGILTCCMHKMSQ